MVRNLKVSIAEYLRTHKRLVVPQLGAFIVKAPGGEVLFSELFKRDDGVLRGLLTAGGASEIEAAGAIDRLIFDLRHAVQSGGRYTFEGIGTFSAGLNGALAFVGETPAGAAAESVPAPADGAGEQAPVADAPAASGKPASGAAGSEVSDAREGQRRSRYEPDPCVKGLTYGQPVKSTDPYTLVGSKPARRIDTFLIVAVVAALLAVGVIVYGYLGDRRARRIQADYLEEVVPGDVVVETEAE